MGLIIKKKLEERIVIRMIRFNSGYGRKYDTLQKTNRILTGVDSVKQEGALRRVFDVGVDQERVHFRVNVFNHNLIKD
jgi:hypothetical protein